MWLKPSKIRPDVIVNAAAHTAVDKTESEPEFAQLLNATSVESIAKAANEVGARVIHYSTDYVFPEPVNYMAGDGCNRTLNVYGETKLAGESVTGTLREASYFPYQLGIRR